MNNTKNKFISIVIFLFIIVLLVLWGNRVIYINGKNKVPEVIYYEGEDVIIDFWKLELSESNIFSRSEFKDFFGVELDGESDDDALCIKLKVTAQKDNLQSNDFEIFYENGFQTLTWFQGVDPYLFVDINKEMIQKIIDTKEGNLWIVTNVPSKIVQEEDTYDYILSLFPKVLTIRTKIGKENKMR